ncbi:hypothetical protein TNCV_1793741 [Trichonephila clavipes]|nr:hypothetical protein TNCV_1793741 [Trichonephila clavipes]
MTKEPRSVEKETRPNGALSMKSCNIVYIILDFKKCPIEGLWNSAYSGTLGPKSPSILQLLPSCHDCGTTLDQRKRNSRGFTYAVLSEVGMQWSKKLKDQKYFRLIGVRYYRVVVQRASGRSVRFEELLQKKGNGVLRCIFKLE